MKKEKKNIVIRILTNIYFKNVMLMVILFLLLVGVTLVGLDFYTKHNESVEVPLVKGLQVAEASKILESADLEYQVVDSVFQSGKTPGAIIDQTPLGKTNVKRGRTVFLIVQAKSEPMVSIPQLVDISKRQAEAQLKSLGFDKIIINEVPSQFKGLVKSVTYKGKEVTPDTKIPKGATITLVVGAGGEEEENSSTDQEPNVDQSFFQ